MRPILTLDTNPMRVIHYPQADDVRLEPGRPTGPSSVPSSFVLGETHTRARSEAHEHFIRGFQSGSIMESMTLADRRAFRKWLKDTDHDRHVLERQLRWNGACVSNSDRFGQA